MAENNNNQLNMGVIVALVIAVGAASTIAILNNQPLEDSTSTDQSNEPDPVALNEGDSTNDLTNNSEDSLSEISEEVESDSDSITNDEIPTTSSPNPTTNQPSTSESETITESTSAYSDGTYGAIGVYSSPGGQEDIEVTLTVANDIVTDVEIGIRATGGRSRNYQELFAEGIEGEVVGQNVDDISLSIVNGSSLTPTGFNNALLIIKSQASN